MAKKEKIELTPEELEAKKARKKEKRGIFGKTFLRVWGWLLAVVLVYSVAHIAFGQKATVAVSGTAPAEQTTKAPTQDSWAFGDEPTTASGSDDASDDNGTGGGSSSEEKPTASTGLSISSKQEAADLLNKATAKIAGGKAGYKYAKVTEYTDAGMKLDSNLMETLANAALGRLDPPTNIANVVGGFIEVGEKSGTFSKGSAMGKNADGEDLKDIESMKVSTITANDIASYSVSGNTVTIDLVDSTEPLRDNGCALSRLTNDFLNKDDVVAALANQNDVPATLNSDKSTINYTGTQIKIAVNGDNATAIQYTFICDARVSIALAGIVTAEGNGQAQRRITYSDIKY